MNLLTHSPAIRHLGYFQLFSVTNNAILNIYVHISSPSYAKITRDVYLRVELYAQPKKEMPNCFPDWLIPVCPCQQHLRVPIRHILPNTHPLQTF